MRSHFRPLPAACVIMLSLAAGLAAWRLSTRTSGDPLADLAAAVGSNHDIDARLSGGFQPKREREPRRSPVPSDAGARLSPDARIAIAQIEKRAVAERTPRALGALGVAYLVGGDVDRSIAALDEAIALSDDPAYESDLSAAYLAKAARQPSRRVEYLARGLESAAKSLRIGPTDAARFNYALAVASLSPDLAAPDTLWGEYVRSERDPNWIAEGRRRAAAASPPSDPQQQWNTRREFLRRALANDDRRAVEETASTFPAGSLEVLERELLPEWARSAIDGERDRASLWLTQAKMLAHAIVTVTADRLPEEGVAVVESSAHSSVLSSRARELAAAHLRYADAMASYDADDYASARRAWEDAAAGFRKAASPYAQWSDVMLGTLFFNQRQMNDADVLLARVESVARQHDYRTLLGRALWSRGLVAVEQWRLSDALHAFRESASCFEASSERENAASLYNLVGYTLNMLGEHQQSWQYLGRTLEGFASIRKAVRRYVILYNASLFALHQDLLEAALLFQNAAVHAAQARDGRAALIDALTNRAAVRARRGEFADAERDLSEAASSLDDTADSRLMQYHVAELARVRGELDNRRGVPVRDRELRDALSYFSRAEPSHVPAIYLTLARGFLASRNTISAVAALDGGITALEKQQARLTDEAFRVSYFDEAWSLFPEMIELQLRALDEPRAFAYAERARGRSLLRGSEPVGLPEVQRALPESTAMTYYLSLRDRLLIWVVTRREHRLIEVPISTDSIERVVSGYRATLSQDPEPSPQAASALYDALWRPVLESLRGNRTIVVVPDGVIQRVPFAAIRDGASGRYVIEDFEVVQAPSATFFASELSHEREPGTGALESALLIGDPAAGGGSAAPSLPGAAAEAMGAASVYTRRELLLGKDATKRAFLERAPRHDIVHFGGHAFANIEYPLLSRLSFSETADPGGDSLFAHEIARMHFTRTRVVVLAACSTAAGGVSRGEGVMSLARPFLAAGVPLVVASQWDVDDGSTERLFTVFHRSMAGAHDPVAALRNAQLAMLKGDNRDDASPRRWGAFIALGTSGRRSTAAIRTEDD